MSKYPKPLFTYYGGKQSMLNHIIPHLPPHGCYVEPFCGGASVFFAKPKAKTNVLNDVNGRLVHFYRTPQDPAKAEAVASELSKTLYSRAEYERARAINRAELGAHDDVTTAWACFLWYQMSRGGKWCAGFNAGPSPVAARRINAYRRYVRELTERARSLENVVIESRDALHVIRYYDRDYTLFFVDPPYVGTNCGGLGDYNAADYAALLEVLARIKGRFMLTSYQNDALSEAIEAYGWHARRVEKKTSILNADKYDAIDKRRVEVFVTNYEANKNGLNL